MPPSSCPRATVARSYSSFTTWATSRGPAGSRVVRPSGEPEQLEGDVGCRREFAYVLDAGVPELAGRVQAVAFDAVTGRLDVVPAAPAVGTKLRWSAPKLIAAASGRVPDANVRALHVLAPAPVKTGPATTFLPPHGPIGPRQPARVKPHTHVLLRRGAGAGGVLKAERRSVRQAAARAAFDAVTAVGRFTSPDVVSPGLGAVLAPPPPPRGLRLPCCAAVRGGLFHRYLA